MLVALYSGDVNIMLYDVDILLLFLTVNERYLHYLMKRKVFLPE